MKLLDKTSIREDLEDLHAESKFSTAPISSAEVIILGYMKGAKKEETHPLTDKYVGVGFKTGYFTSFKKDYMHSDGWLELALERDIKFSKHAAIQVPNEDVGEAAQYFIDKGFTVFGVYQKK